MKSTRRVRQCWIRWTSLCACFSMILTSLVLFPVRTTSGRAGLPGQQENETRNGKARKVRAQPPRSGPPNGILPNLDEARRTSSLSPKAPDAVPSTGRRRGRGHRQGARLTNDQKDRSLLASASLPAKRREMKADVSSSRRSGNDSEPLSDSTAKLFSATTSTAEPLPQNPSNFAMARLAPGNRTGTGGEDLLSNNFNWNLPLVALNGRGLDLGLSLSYNSLVWTRSGNDIDYDLDEGSIAPGFRLGFPTVEGPYWNDQAGTSFYLLVTPAGARIELRLTGTANTYEAVDSSHLQLIDYGSSLLVRPTDGTQLNFVTVNSTWRCNQIKDRNGNILTINYNSGADIANITDTLARVVTFNYDGYANLLSITQTWNGQTHYWATFGWGSAYVGYNFPGLTSYGPDGSYVPVLTQVGLADGSRYNFEYNNSYGMVSTIRHYAADNQQRRYATYVTPASSTDCPRLTERRDWAQNWSGINGVPSEVITYFAHDGDGACRMTAPDGTVHKEYYGASWQSGLTTQSEVWSSGVRQKWTTVAWTQDNTSVGYLTNPRVTETNVYDAQGNRRRQTIEYGPYEQWSLPYLVREYAADGATQIRHSFTDYLLTPGYLDRRIIGLIAAVHITNTAWYETKISYHYDDAAQIQATPATTVQHDAAFDTSFLARGNLTAISRWDITDWSTINDGNRAITSRVGYDTNGSPVWSKDPLNHQSSVSYADSFSDGNNSRNTFAYPTTSTDADGFSSFLQYNFDFGALTRTQGPPPAGQSQGAIQTMTYDSAARLQQMTTENTGAYTRYVYGPNYVQSFSTVNMIADEAYAIQVFDGVGRVMGAANNHPGSAGGYRLLNTIYDSMGRPRYQSNPAEINGSWSPTGDDAAGLLYTQQTYDWKGRPLVTTNTDGTLKYASYGGCGCAGGELVTLTDEMGRQQKVYSDVLGRTSKSEVLNWNGTVYSTTTNTYNTRDQVTLARQWAGAENGGGAYQDTTMSYDGYGRLTTKHLPEQDTGAATVFAYYPDDTIQTITDARGASQTFTYNARKLNTGITYTAPGGIIVPGAVTYSYDAASNRTSMVDGLGTTTYQYNQLSAMTAETRYINDLGSNYTLSYSYNLASELKTVTDPFGGTVTYTYDPAGRLKIVNGPNPGNPQYPTYDYIRDIQYRARGDYKHISYGENLDLDLEYNARLKISKFKVGGMVEPYYGQGASYVLMMQSLFEYYADGTIQGVRLAEGGGYANTYNYDHVSRAQSASHYLNYSQNYGYDVWNNLTSRTGSYYGMGKPPYSATYVNNRNTAWGYDQAGNMTSDGQRTYSYDAANRPIFASGLNVWQLADGDGRVVKATKNGETSHYIRSTVISDQIITELSAQGARKVRYVYANGRLLAEIMPQINLPDEIFWVHENPVTSERMVTAWCGINVRYVSVDALGNAVENYNYSNTCWGTEPDPTQELMQTNWDAMYGDSNNSATGCYVDGIETSCSRASQLVNVGAGVELPPGMSADRYQAVSNGRGFQLAILYPYGDGLRAEVVTAEGHNSGPRPQLRQRTRGPRDEDDEPPLVFNLTAGNQLANEHRNFGPITPDQLKLANKAIASRYDYCKNKWFGTRDTLGTRRIPGRDASRLTLAAGMNNAAIATRLAGIFSQESNFSLDPSQWGNDAGPAQLTGAVLTVWPWALVDDAFGTRLVRHSKGHLAINNKGQWDGSNFDNMATARNIVMTYGSDYDAAYAWGPGHEAGGAAERRERDKYAREVTARTPTYRNFFDCLLGKD